MQTMDTDEIVGTDLFSKDGRELGEITSLQIDVDTWKVRAINVKLRRAVLEDMELKKPLLGSQTVQINVGELSGIADSAVLKRSLEDVLYSGGHPSPDAEKQQNEESKP